jgi:hypothetical protein
MPHIVPAKRRPGAPVGNTNALKHGRRSRTRGQLLKLMGMIQQAYPEWIADPRQVPEPLAALFLALAERDNAIEQAISAPKVPKIHLNKAVIEKVQQTQAKLEKRGSPFPKDIENKQPTTINSPSPLSARRRSASGGRRPVLPRRRGRGRGEETAKTIKQ